MKISSFLRDFSFVMEKRTGPLSERHRWKRAGDLSLEKYFLTELSNNKMDILAKDEFSIKACIQVETG